MGRIWMPGGGGGADLDVITAGAGDVLAGKVIVDKDGNPLTGTIPDNTGTALEVATNGKTLIPKGYFDGTTYVTNTQATMAGGTKTPTTSAQTIACNGKLMTSNIVIPAFTLPSASIIKKGETVNIYGKTVTGTCYVWKYRGSSTTSSGSSKSFTDVTGASRNLYYIDIPNVGFIPASIWAYSGYGNCSVLYRGDWPDVILKGDGSDHRQYNVDSNSNITISSSTIRLPVVISNTTYYYFVAGYDG